MTSSLSSLKNCTLLSGIDAAGIDDLKALFTEHKMSEGRTVFVENMAGESLYLISQGTVAIYKMLAENEEKTIAVLGAGEVFGELALVENNPRAATARVAEDATILSIKKIDFDKFCQDRPAVALKLLRNIVSIFTARLRETDSDFRDRFKTALSEMP